MPAKETNPSLSSSGMGGKATSGSAYSPPRAPRPPRAPIPRPPFLPFLTASGTRRTRGRNAEGSEAARLGTLLELRLASLERWVHESRLVDWLYLGGFVAVLGLAACILAIG